MTICPAYNDCKSNCKEDSCAFEWIECEIFKKLQKEKERKYSNVSIDVLEDVYRKYMKGDIMDKSLAYNTSKTEILNRLKMHFESFLNTMINEDII